MKLLRVSLLLCVGLASNAFSSSFLDYDTYFNSTYLAAKNGEIEVEGYQFITEEIDVVSVGLIKSYRDNTKTSYVSVLVQPLCKLYSEKFETDIPEIEIIMDVNAQVVSVFPRFGIFTKNKTKCVNSN